MAPCWRTVTEGPWWGFSHSYLRHGRVYSRTSSLVISISR